MTLSAVVQYFGMEGWGNNYYQLNVWKTLATQPLETCIVVCKGGVLYIVVLIATFFHAQSVLPAAVQVAYPPGEFSMGVFMKTGIIYAMPVIFYILYKKHFKIAD